jgi:hypothetical protein
VAQLLLCLVVALLAALGSPTLAPAQSLAPIQTQGLAFAEGDLLQATGDDKIHLVENGQRRWIVDTRSLRRLDPDFSRLRRVPFEELDRLPAGRPYREGPVIRDGATGQVYLLTQETGWPDPRRRWLDNLNTFVQLGFAWEDVRLDWPVPAAAYADAPAVSYRPVSREPTTVQTALGELTAVPFWRLQVQDEQLFAALALASTHNSDWRALVVPRLAEQGTWITWGELPAQIAGTFSTRLNRITVSNRLRDEPPGILAATLTHEAVHAITPPNLSPEACLREEAQAFALEAQTWVNLPPQYRQSDSELAQFQHQLATVWRQQGLPGLHALVASHPAYQHQCRALPIR